MKFKGYILVLLLLLCYAVVLNIQRRNAVEKAKRFEVALGEINIEYADKLGRKVKEISQLEVRVNELKSIGKKDSAEMSMYEKRLYSIYRELELNNRRLKNVESALLFSTQTRDTFGIRLVEDKGLKIGHYENKWLNQEFAYNPISDSLFVLSEYENEFFIDLYKRRKLNKKNNKVFVLWRWVSPWEYKASIKSLNDSTIIKESVLVNIK